MSIDMKGSLATKNRLVKSVYKTCEGCQKGRWIDFNKSLRSKEAADKSSRCDNCGELYERFQFKPKRGWTKESVAGYAFDPVVDGHRALQWHDKKVKELESRSAHAA